MARSIPTGTRDVLPDEMRELRAIESMLGRLFEERGDRPGGIDVEDGLHHRGLGAGTDPIGLGARTGDQQQGVHHDGLAGAGLAGQHVEAGGEGHHRLLHHRQVPDRQLTQHRAGHARAPAGAAQLYPIARPT